MLLCGMVWERVGMGLVWRVMASESKVRLLERVRVDTTLHIKK